MGYIKVANKKILEQIDSNSQLPNGWDTFIEKQKKYHNLIIKNGKDRCYCTNCNSSFISKKKVGQEVKCPYCRYKYLIKRSNLRYFDFKDYYSILDYINETFVIRYFELKTIIDSEHKARSSIVEFAREMIGDKCSSNLCVNDRVSRTQCHIYISHSRIL